MRLIDADNYKGKVIASHCYSGVNKLIRIDDVPTVDVNNLIIAEFEKFKADLENLSENEWNKQVGADKGLELAIDVIEDKITELKGENKKRVLHL